jgi:hypothetical protein
MKAYRPLFYFLAAILIGQGLSFVSSPEAWRAYWNTLPRILSMIAFWGPIIALIMGTMVYAVLYLFGIKSMEQLREESVEQNNPAPAIIFTGAGIIAILFLTLVIRP